MDFNVPRCDFPFIYLCYRFTKHLQPVNLFLLPNLKNIFWPLFLQTFFSASFSLWPVLLGLKLNQCWIFWYYCIGYWDSVHFLEIFLPLCSLDSLIPIGLSSSSQALSVIAILMLNPSSDFFLFFLLRFSFVYSSKTYFPIHSWTCHNSCFKILVR